MKKEKLKLYGVRLRLDQIEFLKDLDDAAKVIRQIIDNYILESGKPDVILINKKITILNKRINQIVNSPLYKACEFNIKARDRVADYEQEHKTQYPRNVRLQSPASFQVGYVERNSEQYERVITESVDIMNTLYNQLRKYTKQIKDLEEQLKSIE